MNCVDEVGFAVLVELAAGQVEIQEDATVRGYELHDLCHFTRVGVCDAQDLKAWVRWRKDHELYSALLTEDA
ncbi:MAG: hypothetical protein IJ092_04075, partial [Atopobiaceae bacterium]|nr:hypothetical protein [Atopobiaceae bacterium]